MLADIEGSSKAKKRLEARKRRNKLMVITIVVVLVALVVVGAAGFLFYTMLSSDGDDDNNNSFVTMTKDNVRIPVSDVNDGNVYFLTYAASGGVEIEYMVVQGTDGKIRTAFNRCDNETCIEVDAAFTQDGYYLKCDRIGCTYPINLIGTTRPNCCVPFPLAHTIEDGNVVINRSDLEAGKVHFE